MTTVQRTAYNWNEYILVEYIMAKLNLLKLIPEMLSSVHGLDIDQGLFSLSVFPQNRNISISSHEM